MNIYLRAKRLKFSRMSPFGEVMPVDSGCGYFVVALERMGAKTLFSCEGHFDRPNYEGGDVAFYVLFLAPLEVALKISHLGYFTVELSSSVWASSSERPDPSGNHCWSIRARFSSPKMKTQILKAAAEKWQQALDLSYEEIKANSKYKPDTTADK